MSKMSFMDKIGILFEVSKNSLWVVILIILLIGLGILFYKTDKKNIQRNKIIYLMISIFIIVVLLVSYSSSLSKLLDYMMNNLFIAIYFPNVAIYMAALILMNIILWVSIFHYKTSELIKKLNITVYIVMNYLLALILSIISKENLDIFTQESIYGNKQVTALIELSSTLFMVWIIFLVLYKGVLFYLRKDYQPKVKKVVVRKEVKRLPENYSTVVIPNTVKQNEKSTSWKDTKKKEALLQAYEEMLTLEDYKQLLKILKEEQKKKQDNHAKIKNHQDMPGTKIEITLPQPLKLKVEEVQERELEKEQEKYTELERLYRGIR